MTSNHTSGIAVRYYPPDMVLFPRNSNTKSEKKDLHCIGSYISYRIAMKRHFTLDDWPDNAAQMLLPYVTNGFPPQQKKRRVEITWQVLETRLGKGVTANIKKAVEKHMHCEMIILLFVLRGYEVPPHYDAAAQQAVLYLTPCESAAGRLHYRHTDGSGVEVHPTDAKTLVVHNGRDTLHWTPTTDKPRFTLTFADRCGEEFRRKMMRAIRRYHRERYPMWLACHDKDGSMVEDCVVYIQRLYNGRSDPPNITRREYAQRIEDMRNVLKGRAYSPQDVFAYVRWMDRLTSTTRRIWTKTELSPSEQVDEVWHVHLQSPDYDADMNEVWRREKPVLHVPEPVPEFLDEKKNDVFAFLRPNTHKPAHANIMDIEAIQRHAQDNLKLILAAVVAFDTAAAENDSDTMRVAREFLPSTGLDGAFATLAQNDTFVTSLRDSYANTAMDDDMDSETTEKAKAMHSQIRVEQGVARRALQASPEQGTGGNGDIPVQRSPSVVLPHSLPNSSHFYMHKICRI